MRWYIDTSAAVKLLVREDESDDLLTALANPDIDLVACYLLETELRRAAARLPEVTQSAVAALLDGVALHETPPSLYREAGLLPGLALRSLDAVHLAAAIRLGVDRVVCYDHRMQESADSLGLNWIAPGATATG